MTANNKAKLKMLYIMKFLEEETDAEHGLSMSEIITKLAEEGIAAERKGVYRDIAILREFGLNIKTYQRNPVEYALDPRDFNLSQLMLLVDAVESSKFLTQQQADMLVGNVKSLASASQQEQLDRRIHVTGRINAEESSVFRSIDLIHQAIRERRQLRFRYLHYGADGERRPSLDDQGEEFRQVTPLEISYDGGFYYLAAWDEGRERISQFRVDRMDSLDLSDDPATRNEETEQFAFDEDNSYEYFGRFGGEARMVTLSVRGDKVEIIKDRFGDKADILQDGENARAFVKVHVSPQFFGWIAGMEGLVAIAEPKDVAQEYCDYLRGLLEGAEQAAGAE